MREDEVAQYRALAAAFNMTRPANLEEDPAWIGSPFEGVGARGPGIGGKWAERAVRYWLRENGLVVDNPLRENGPYDLIIGGDRIEQKTGTTVDGIFRVNQIRDQKYRFVLILCLMPRRALAWLVEKNELRAHAKNQHAQSERCKMLTLDALNPPAWLGGDGSLCAALEAIRTACPTRGVDLFSAEMETSHG